MKFYIFLKKKYFKDELPISIDSYTVGTDHQPLSPGKFHKREFWKIAVVIPKNADNKETLVCNGKNMDVRSGIIYLVHPDDWTTVHFSPGTVIMNILILNDFMQNVVKGLYSTTDFFRIFEPVPPESCRFLHYTPLVPNLIKLLKKISFETKHTDANTPAMLKHLLGEFLIEFERNYHLHQGKIRSKNMIPDFESYLRKNFLSRIHPETAACEFGVTEKYLLARFRKETGCTVKERLTELRLDHAAKLLEETDLRISEIRQRSGFPNPNSFFGAFREKYACTPQEYRNRRKPK